MNGEPEATVTTVIVAGRARPGTDLPAAVVPVRDRRRCRPAAFPSYALRRRAKALGSVSQLELLLVAAAVAEGWAVSVPDHEGLSRATWGAPYEPGYRVLDGIRAALSSERIGLSPSAPIGLWGYSGGGLASAWAAEMCGQYAPELDIVGAVLGSPVGDLGNTFRRLNGGLLAGLPAMVVAALSHTYPDLDRVIKEHTNDEGRALLEALEKMTTVEAVLRMAGKDMGDYLDEPLEDILSTPEVAYVFDNIKLGAAVPTPPVLIVQAVHDYLIDVNDIDALADAYSAGGARVTYHRDAFNEHMLLHPLSAPMALRWLTDRFARRPLTEHLIRTTWPTMFHPDDLRRHGAAGQDRGQGHHRQEGSPPSAMTRLLLRSLRLHRLRPTDGSRPPGGPPGRRARSRRPSAAYTSAAMPAGQIRVIATCSGPGRRTPAAPRSRRPTCGRPDSGTASKSSAP